MGLLHRKCASGAAIHLNCDPRPIAVGSLAVLAIYSIYCTLARFIAIEDLSDVSSDFDIELAEAPPPGLVASVGRRPSRLGPIFRGRGDLA
jgi:hypothetical protein